MFGVEPLRPAYGRDYKSKKEVQADFDKCLDFMAANGQYTSKMELKKLYPNMKQITIRYKKLTMSADFKI